MTVEKPLRHTPWRTFFLNLSLVLMLFVAALYTGIFISRQQAIETEIDTRAKALLHSVMMARQWNSQHGGVFVEKRPGKKSHPFFPEITGSNGKTYTLVNPALMTREISDISAKDGAFQFHITSLKLLNPDNAPDAFERKALLSFEKGKKDALTKEKRRGSTYYRYMTPLYTESSCLPCHGFQGYKVGDVRGGISVSFNIDPAIAAAEQSRRISFALFLLTSFSILGIVYRLIWVLHRRLELAEARIRELAVTDELTRLKNRRYVLGRLAEELERARRYHHPFSCILFDVDHFKKVNDTFGHDAGDDVLKTVSAIALAQCRQADTLGRYGGEEFLILLPETDEQGALVFAERVRTAIAEFKIPLSQSGELQVTASFGVASTQGASPEDFPGEQALLKLADEALYWAKDAGRNRVELANLHAKLRA